ncbi:phosphoglycerate dehydrogenase [Oscillospiraceae bacterium MB08-C2-2]|nr:phosphoglycerate dehydrogenase [Oscillospiraceae bacterium MB08-C2-2]
MKVLCTPSSFKSKEEIPALTALKEFADEIVINPQHRPLEEDELIELLQDCDGMVAGIDFITTRVLNACPKLKVVSRYGVGYDRVDIAAAKENGIVVTNTPGANAMAVADLAIGLLLAVAREIPRLDKGMKEDKWLKSDGVEIYEKTIGILGLGAIGKGVAKRAQGFSMKVLAYDPFMNMEYAKSNNITPVSLDELLEQSDFISLHLPATPETFNLLDKAAMSKMKKGAIIINTARGGIIDDGAAYELLKSGHLGGMGIDAFVDEPPKHIPLFDLDNVVLTPHTAAHTAEAMNNMANMSVQNLIDVLSGKECPFIVNR